MGAENANFEFNLQSEAYERKLDPTQRDKHHLIQQAHQTEKQTHQADYDRHKPQRIEEREKFLTQHYRAQFNMPRPAGTPAPAIPTAEQIRNRALQDVEQAHARDSEAMNARHKNAIEEFFRQALNLPNREHVRRAAFMNRRQQDRERERDQDRER